MIPDGLTGAADKETWHLGSLLAVDDVRSILRAHQVFDRACIETSAPSISLFIPRRRCSAPSPPAGPVGTRLQPPRWSRTAASASNLAQPSFWGVAPNPPTPARHRDPVAEASGKHGKRNWYMATGAVETPHGLGDKEKCTGAWSHFRAVSTTCVTLLA